MNTKLQNVRLAMKEKGMDALFVTNELNQRYLLGYPFTDGMLLILPEVAYMVTDFRYYEEAQAHADPAFEVVMPAPRAPFVTEVLEKHGVKTVGYESASLSCDEFDRLSKLYGTFTFLPCGNLFSTIRKVKEPAALDKIARAQQITDMAFSHILKVMTPEMTEIDVALELEFFMRKHGAEATAFETISVSGDASALPHGKPRAVKLKAGFLTMDYGALYEGYCSDMTRTVVIGKADAEMKRLYQTVLEAQTAALAVIREGMECAAVDKVARDIINGAGYEGCFGHGLGHGVGLFIHEKPSLSSVGGKDVILESGNVVTVEPGISLRGKYGCRIEDMVAVTPDGCRNFTASPKELIELF